MTKTDHASDAQDRILREVESGSSLRISGPALSGKTRLLRELAQRPGVIYLDANLMSAQMSGAQAAWTLLPSRNFHAPGPFNLDDASKAVLRSADMVVVDNCGQLRIDTFQQLRDALFLCPTGYGPFAGRQLILSYDPAGLPAPVTPPAAAFADRHYGGDARIEASRYFHDLSEFQLAPAPGDAPIPSAAGIHDVHDLQEGVVLVTNDAVAAQVNDSAMSDLPGGVYRLPAELQGDFAASPAMPVESAFKRGSRIILTSSDDGGAWRAGDTGILLACERDADGSPVAVVGHQGGAELRVGPVALQSVRHGAARVPGAGYSLQRHITGTLMQVPILPGWAISARALNGLTLDAPALDITAIGDPALVRSAVARARVPDAIMIFEGKCTAELEPAE